MSPESDRSRADVRPAQAPGVRRIASIKFLIGALIPMVAFGIPSSAASALAAPALAAPALAVPGAAGSPILHFDVDFSRWRDQPLVKDKIGVYQTPFLSTGDLIKAVGLLPEVGVHNLRYELAWGKPDVLNPGQAALHADFGLADRFSAALKEYAINPLLVIGYCPGSLKSRKVWASWQDPPNNLNDWQTITRNYAEHLRSVDALSGTSYEVWNEPDLSLGNPPEKGALQRSENLRNPAACGPIAGCAGQRWRCWCDGGV